MAGAVRPRSHRHGAPMARHGGATAGRQMGHCGDFGCEVRPHTLHGTTTQVGSMFEELQNTIRIEVHSVPADGRRPGLSRSALTVVRLVRSSVAQMEL
jgi:hypothetical protein